VSKILYKEKNNTLVQPIRNAFQCNKLFNYFVHICGANMPLVRIQAHIGKDVSNNWFISVICAVILNNQL